MGDPRHNGVALSRQAPAEVTAYPRRLPVFAVKYVRLMGDVRLGTDIGTDACWLLAYIAGVEDDLRYTQAVKFWSEDLAAKLGFSLSTFKRARERAVTAGWLSYQPGARGRQATYFVLDPTRTLVVDDPDAGPIQGQIDPQSGHNPAAIRSQSGREVDRLHSYTSSESSTEGGAATAAAAVTGSKEKPKKAPDRKKGRRQPDDLFDAVAEVTGSDPAVSGAHVSKVRHLLAGAEPPYTPADVREFARRYHDLCPWAADKNVPLSLGVIEKHIGKLRATNPTARNRQYWKRPTDDPATENVL